MATWTEFADAAPELAASIRVLVHQFGPGFGYLATVRGDGGPRVHPVSPLITDDGLFCFVIDSPKRRDLDRDGRYALHSFPPEDCDDEACVTGRAVLVADPVRRARLAHLCRAAGSVDWSLYEFTVDSAMLARRESGLPQNSVSPSPTTHYIPVQSSGAQAAGVARSAEVRPAFTEPAVRHEIWRDPAAGGRSPGTTITPETPPETDFSMSAAAPTIREVP